jgi:hypothetical protein
VLQENYPGKRPQTVWRGGKGFMHYNLDDEEEEDDDDGDDHDYNCI